VTVRPDLTDPERIRVQEVSGVSVQVSGLEDRRQFVDLE
jgi:hypothetical protein